MFNRLTKPPLFVNSFNISGTEDKEALNNLIYTHYDGDVLQTLPSCSCRRTTGGFFVESVCEYCGDVVTVVTERPLESALWLKPPPGVDVFINPQCWTILSAALTIGGQNLLRWLCDPNATLPEDGKHVEIKKIRNLKIERGINAFHRNFDQIVELLFEHRIFKSSKLAAKDDLREFITKFRKNIFCRQLPMPSKLGFITEHNLPNSYADLTMVTAVNALLIISSAINSPVPLSQKTMQSYSVKANQMLAEYYQNFIATNMVSKPGLLRKHVAGTRMHFTFRGVISSISEPHNYRELHLPWSMAVLTFKMHLVSKLVNGSPTREGIPPNTALRMVYENTLQYNPLIDQLLQELIDESPEIGFPVLLGRNPTLTRGSIQKFYVTKIHKDLNVKSIGISVLCLVAPNGLVESTLLLLVRVVDHHFNCWKLLRA